MADDLNSRLNGILSDPTALQQIMSIASGLMSKPNEPPGTQPEESSIPTSVPMPPQNKLPKLPKDDRCELLYALKPFLRETRAERLDLMIRVLQITALTKRR